VVVQQPGRLTEAGVVPGDWSIRSLSDLLDLRNGFNADRSAYGRGLRFINVLEVITHSHISAAQIPGRVALPRMLLDAYAVRRGDILFNRTSETHAEVGLAAVYNDDELVTFGGFVIRGRPRDRSLDSTFAGYVLRATAVRTQITARGQGAIHTNIGQADLARVLVPVPSLREQVAIAGALADVDRSATSLAGLIDKKRNLRRAVADRLLHGTLRLPGFDGEWHAQPLNRIGAFSKGRGIRKDEVAYEGLPCIRYGEIYTHHTDRVRRFNSFIPRSVARQSKRLHSGDLLFAGSGETADEIGKCVAFIGDEEAYAGSDIVILSPSGHDPLFLAYLMNSSSVARQKARLGQGDAVVHISARELGRMEVPVPGLEEQRAIAVVLSEMDAEIGALEAQLAKARDLKTAMAQELLSGRTRLI
jgi:type I restriction enzyme S subunit